ncbi:large ribosomal subunit protein bL19m [Periplaneta americana]|uniref:large ribosomal subunit protein bL19m n=1 Tax=Periplaneta americana TaxID=6978 RepID=UPI0037E8D811
MALLSYVCRRLSVDLKSSLFQNLANVELRCLSSVAPSSAKSEETPSEQKKEQSSVDTYKNVVPLECRFVYPEFLPDPKIEWRNAVREKLERMDMMNRRAQIDIPEFYVGSIMAVTASNPHAPDKSGRFVGICIQRGGCGLRAFFILRNVIDHQGMEMFYEMYSPVIQKIEVLRLEKRLDNELMYLRDALPEYSTFPLDMEPEFLPEGAPVPVNPIKVKMKPRPWLERWERQDLQGVDNIESYVSKWRLKRAAAVATPWNKYDLMKEYRESIPEEEQIEIFSDVYSQLHQLEVKTRKMKRKRTFVKPKKTG